MQKVSANLVNTSGDILNLLLVLEHYKNDGGPSETEFREEYVRDGTFNPIWTDFFSIQKIFFRGSF